MDASGIRDWLLFTLKSAPAFIIDFTWLSLIGYLRLVDHLLHPLALCRGTYTPPLLQLHWCPYSVAEPFARTEAFVFLRSKANSTTPDEKANVSHTHTHHLAVSVRNYECASSKRVVRTRGNLPSTYVSATIRLSYTVPNWHCFPPPVRRRI